jgi:hypothetical protein
VYSRIYNRILRRRSRIGQVSIMEYILLTFFILVIILALLLFLSWWQLSQIGMQEHNIQMDKVFFTARYVSSSPYFVKENSVFDDAKLTAIQSLGSSVCKDFERVLGYNWFIKVKIFEGDTDIPCTWNNYPDCNIWEICTRVTDNEKTTSRILPVNVYRKISEENGVGIMEAGVYI